MKRLSGAVALCSLLFASCATTVEMGRPNEFESSSNAASLEEELENNEKEERGFLVQEELKVQDVQETVVFVDRPVYIPEEKSNTATERKNRTGVDAVNDSQKKATQKPENYKSGTFFYQFNENFVFEVYAQPYHLTDIILESGDVEMLMFCSAWICLSSDHRRFRHFRHCRSDEQRIIPGHT